MQTLSSFYAKHYAEFATGLSPAQQKIVEIDRAGGQPYESERQWLDTCIRDVAKNAEAEFDAQKPLDKSAQL